MIQAKAITETLQLERIRGAVIWFSMTFIITGWTSVAEPGKEMEPMAIYIKDSEGNSISLSFRKLDQTNQELSLNDGTPLFYAIQSLKWPNGLVPIYQTRDKQTKRWKLSRRLTHGKENFTDPLFFALPPNLNFQEGIISGRWACEAKHRDGTIDFLHWEMGREGETIFGRFDQDTDYRFAWLIGGTFSGNNLRFKAEYIDATYELEGSLLPHIRRLEGTWKHTEDADGGTWTAEPAYPITMENQRWKRVDLYQDISASTANQTLSIGKPISKGSRLLCQVWLPKKGP